MTPDAFLELGRVLPEPMLLLSDVGIVRALTAPAEATLAQRADAVVGRPFASLLVDDHDRVAALLRRWRRSPEFSPAALTWKRGPDRAVPMRCEGAALRGAPHPAHILVRCGGSVLQESLARFTTLNQRVEALTQEIRRRRVAERQHVELLVRERSARESAVAASRVKDDFLATLSHELRTPLNAIFGWARMLQAGTLEHQESQRAIDVIVRNAGAQRRLVDDLLDFGRIHSGKLRLDVRPLHPIDLVRTAVDAAQPAAEAKAIRLMTHLDPRAGPVSADPDRLQQVLWNLLSNAIKFTPAGGEVEVQVRRETTHVAIDVSDTGRGIAPDVLPYVFDMFRQAEAGSTRTNPGLGLGLTLVKHLVEAHGGSVEAASPGLDRGATFRVMLPLLVHADLPAAPATPAVDEAAGAAEPATIAGVRVLVVEDDPESLELQAHLLNAGGGEVRIARSVAEAMDVLKGWRPDVLVSDIEMPAEDGYALMRRLRAVIEGRIPAVAVTAYGRSHDRARAFNAGFDAHMTKPIEPTEFLAVVASLSRR